MKFNFWKRICSVALVASACTAVHAAEGYFEYFDCWLENASTIIPSERSRIGAQDDSKVCGCFKVREQGGYGWRGNEPKKIVQVYRLPRPKITPCPGGLCEGDEGALAQCMDYVRSSPATLRDFTTGHAMEGAANLTLEDGWTNTPFGEYFEKRKSRADSIDCFFNIHERPDIKPDDRSHPETFSFSGMPRKLIPSAIGRFTDYSEVRCLDNGELTGFAANGVVETVRHVDKKGVLQGEEIGYMNDPTYPPKQDAKWGKVAWTANYKNGMREGIATFYKSSVLDSSDKEYYFKHLEVPFKQGFMDGTARMYSDTGFLMAEIPVRRGGFHGRMTVHNPYKKKKVILTFNANQLEGFVDFGDFGGVYHNGLPNGLITFWSVKDTCYYWMPGQSVCYTERLKKRQWGTYKMGKFQGSMECWNGAKGDINLECPEPPLDTVKVDSAKVPEVNGVPAEVKDSTKAPELAKVQDTTKVPAEGMNSQELQDKATKARVDAEKAREEARKALEAAEQAEQAAKLAEEEAAKATSSKSVEPPAKDPKVSKAGKNAKADKAKKTKAKAPKSKKKK